MVDEKRSKTKDDFLLHYDMLVLKEHKKIPAFGIHPQRVKHVLSTFQNENNI